MNPDHTTFKQRLKNVSEAIKSNWKTILKAIFPYFIGVSIGVTTFFIYAHFNSDNIQIESVIVGPKELCVPIDHSFSKELQEFLNMDGDGFTGIATNLDNEYLLQVFNALYIRSNEIKEDIKSLENLRNQLAEIKGDSISRSKAIEIGLNSSGMYELYEFERQNQHKKELEEYIRKNLIENKANDEKANRYIRSLVSITKRTLKNINDKFQVQVIAFNNGNQQTVLRYKATLKVGANELSMVKVNNEKVEDFFAKLGKAISANTRGDGSSNYIVVPPKSYVILALEVDGKLSNTPKDIKFINREYSSGASIATITLFDIHNEPIQPWRFRLQSDVEYNPNSKIIEFLEKHFSALIDDELE